jgi:hypothetical protein
MSLSTWSLDTDSKRWLAVLAAACLVSVAMLAHSFMKALSPAEENSAAVQKPATAVMDGARTRSEPAWSSSPQIAATENHEEAIRVSPFDGKNKLLTERDKVAEQQAAQQAEVHRQAEYLRGLIAAGKLPAGYGHLTKEQVDDMEKKGITIE